MKGTLDIAKVKAASDPKPTMDFGPVRYTKGRPVGQPETWPVFMHPVFESNVLCILGCMYMQVIFDWVEREQPR